MYYLFDAATVCPVIVASDSVSEIALSATSDHSSTHCTYRKLLIQQI